MVDFWERKRQQVQPQTPASAPAQSSGPWWQRGTEVLTQRQTVPQNPAQSPTEAPTGNSIDGHDISGAKHIRNEENCPDCGRDGFFKVSQSSAPRCYFCGYISGRDIHDLGMLSHAVAEGPAQRARQTNNGGGVVNNYHGNIKSANQAAGRLG